MRVRHIFCLGVLCICLFNLSAQQLISPNGKLKMNFIVEQGVPQYELSYHEAPVSKPIKLGLVFEEM